MPSSPTTSTPTRAAGELHDAARRSRAARWPSLHGADEAAAEAPRVAEAKLGDWQQRGTRTRGVSSQATHAGRGRAHAHRLSRSPGCCEADQRRTTLRSGARGRRLDDLAQMRSRRSQTQHEQKRSAEVERLTRGSKNAAQRPNRCSERERAAHGDAEREARQAVAGERAAGSASLEALQHAALGQEQGAAAKEWLQRAGLGIRRASRRNTQRRRRLGDAPSKPRWAAGSKARSSTIRDTRRQRSHRSKAPT